MLELFRIHVPDEVLGDLRARLRHTRWPDQVPGIGWEQGTELEWLQRLVCYWLCELAYRRYGAAGYDFGAGVTTILGLDHPESVMGIYLTTLESTSHL